MSVDEMNIGKLRAMAQIAIDMHNALGIAVGDNPFRRIEQLIKTEKAAMKITSPGTIQHIGEGK
jgi:hypothetical protein